MAKDNVIKFPYEKRWVRVWICNKCGMKNAMANYTYKNEDQNFMGICTHCGTTKLAPFSHTRFRGKGEEAPIALSR